MARRNEFDYFDGFVRLAEYSLKAKTLDETSRILTRKLFKNMVTMHEIEHRPI